jgi:hypothetical protein
MKREERLESQILGPYASSAKAAKMLLNFEHEPNFSFC